MANVIKPQRRSSQQNRYLWGAIYPAILTGGGDALKGFIDKDLHELFLGEFFGVKRLKWLGRVIEKPLQRSSPQDKAVFADFILHIQSRAAESGIVIPDPEEQL